MENVVLDKQYSLLSLNMKHTIHSTRL